MRIYIDVAGDTRQSGKTVLASVIANALSALGVRIELVSGNRVMVEHFAATKKRLRGLELSGADGQALTGFLGRVTAVVRDEVRWPRPDVLLEREIQGARLMEKRLERLRREIADAAGLCDELLVTLNGSRRRLEDERNGTTTYVPEKGDD